MATTHAERTFVIRAKSSELNDRAFDSELLPQFVHLFQRKSLSELDRVLLDLRSVSWGNPYGALGVVLLCEVLWDYSPLPIQILLADARRQRRRNTWLGHIGLPAAVSELATVQGNLEDEAALASRYRYLPITRLPGEREAQSRLLKEIAIHTHAVLVRDFNYDAVQAARFITALSELCTNIYDHSAPGGRVRGFIAMQAYKDTVKFAVMDLGVGIPKSLRSQYADLDDASLVLRALEPGVSARQHRGLGLARVCEIVERQRGILNIRTGRCKVLVRGRRRQRELHTLKQHTTFIGTQIGILLRRVAPEGKKESA